MPPHRLARRWRDFRYMLHAHRRIMPASPTGSTGLEWAHKRLPPAVVPEKGPRNAAKRGCRCRAGRPPRQHSARPRNPDQSGKRELVCVALAIPPQRWHRKLLSEVLVFVLADPGACSAETIQSRSTLPLVRSRGLCRELTSAPPAIRLRGSRLSKARRASDCPAAVCWRCCR